MSPRIAIDREQVAEFCRRHHIRRLALFGSVLREDFGAESDVDVLVEFEPGHVPGFGFIDLQDETTASGCSTCWSLRARPGSSCRAVSVRISS